MLKMKPKFDSENPVVQLKSYKEIEEGESKIKPPVLERTLSNVLTSQDVYELDPPDGGHGWVILGKYQL